ncbi:MAG: hypothetical protein HAW67_03630 [Endozoicomonadaceae bacterium]|nr:hypothetical protein [Endozoicomonadaceae bacterium]
MDKERTENAATEQVFTVDKEAWSRSIKIKNERGQQVGLLKSNGFLTSDCHIKTAHGSYVLAKSSGSFSLIHNESSTQLVSAFGNGFHDEMGRIYSSLKPTLTDGGELDIEIYNQSWIYALVLSHYHICRMLNNPITQRVKNE